MRRNRRTTVLCTGEIIRCHILSNLNLILGENLRVNSNYQILHKDKSLQLK